MQQSMFGANGIQLDGVVRKSYSSNTLETLFVYSPSATSRLPSESYSRSCSWQRIYARRVYFGYRVNLLDCVATRACQREIRPDKALAHCIGQPGNVFSQTVAEGRNIHLCIVGPKRESDVEADLIAHNTQRYAKG